MTSTRTAVSLVSLALLTVSAAVLAQGLNLRTGSWEYQLTVEGAIPMDGIPENMRASMEAELRKPRVVKSCLTAEDLKNLRLGKTDDGDDEECKVLSSKVGPTGGDITRECSGDRPRNETIHVEASSPTAMRAVVTSKAAQGTMTTTMVGKWLAAQCRD